MAVSEIEKQLAPQADMSEVRQGSKSPMAKKSKKKGKKGEEEEVTDGEKCKSDGSKSSCNNKKDTYMKKDSLTPHEFLDACDLGIQDRSRSYIRARLDAKTTTAKGKKCGNSYIPRNNSCNNKGTYAGGSKDPSSIRRGVVVGASTGVKVGGAIGGLGGAAAGFKTGGVKGALKMGAVGLALGATAGVVEGAKLGTLFQAGRKTGRAVKRGYQNQQRVKGAMKNLSQGRNESYKQFAVRIGNSATNAQTKVWSPSNEFVNQGQFKKKKRRDSVWAEGFSYGQ